MPQNHATTPLRSPRHLAIVPDQNGMSPSYAPARRKVALPTLEGIFFRKIDEIIFLEASGNYSFLHFSDGQRMLVCRTLAELEEQIKAPHQFIRIHRSFTVNLEFVDHYVRGKGGHVVLHNKKELQVSAGGKPTLMKAINQFFR